MTKIDHRKDLKHLYQPSAKEISWVEVPEMNFLMIDGRGDPNTSRTFQEAIETLFSVAYAAKFLVKREGPGLDYRVMPLEGLWWADDMAEFSMMDKERWQWTLMIMQPEYVTPAILEAARTEVKQKKNPPALPLLRFEAFREGKAAQILHRGPFAEEGPKIAELHRFIETNGYERRGRHHEIYLSDMRRVAPEKLRTILRQPAGEIMKSE